MLHELLVGAALYALLTSTAAASGPPRVQIGPEAAKRAEAAREAVKDLDPAVVEQARKSLQVWENPARQVEREDYRKQIERRIFAGSGAQIKEKKPKGGTPEDGQLYVFVSRSVPLDKLRRLAGELEGRPNAFLVLRGFVDGATKLRPTVAFIAEILKAEPGCEGAYCRMRKTQVIVDPVLFRRYDIARVPAAVFEPDIRLAQHCSDGDDRPRARAVAVGVAGIPVLLAALWEAAPHPALAALRESFE